jgi:hypothetical protein
MKTSRRDFGALVGAAAAFPLAWTEAEAQVRQTGEVSADIVRMLLDLQGSRGIYEHPERFEELRAAVARMIRNRQTLRSFAVPEDVPPAHIFRR